MACLYEGAGVTHCRHIIWSFNVQVESHNEDDLEFNAARREDLDSMSLVTVVEHNKTSVKRQQRVSSGYILLWNAME